MTAKQSLSEKIGDTGLDLCVYPLSLAHRAPRGIIRFLCFPLAMPFCVITLILSIPFIFAVVIVEMWEEAFR